MTNAVQELLESFDAMSEAERQEAAVEILRRVTPADCELSEQALVEAADELFRALDEEEVADGRS
jgi:predicted HAD superfamily phosphohydrolase